MKGIALMLSPQVWPERVGQERLQEDLFRTEALLDGVLWGLMVNNVRRNVEEGQTNK